MSYRPESPQEQRRADRRFWMVSAFGVAQTMAGISTLFLLVARGFSRPTAVVGILTLLLTALSLTLFGRSGSGAKPGK